jgi:CheY-like chemotaxis protein
VTEAGPPIVLVEDDPNDVYFVRHALEKALIVNPLLRFATAEQARNHFAERAIFDLPSMFILDVNLVGRESGIDFLRWLRQQRSPLGSTPAMMLTGSDQPGDRDATAMLGSIYFLRKPVSEDRLTAAVQSLGLMITTLAGATTRRTIERL